MKSKQIKRQVLEALGYLLLLAASASFLVAVTRPGFLSGTKFGALGLLALTLGIYLFVKIDEQKKLDKLLKLVPP